MVLGKREGEVIGFGEVPGLIKGEVLDAALRAHEFEGEALAPGRFIPNAQGVEGHGADDQVVAVAAEELVVAHAAEDLVVAVAAVGAGLGELDV